MKEKIKEAFGLGFGYVVGLVAGLYATDALIKLVSKKKDESNEKTE